MPLLCHRVGNDLGGLLEVRLGHGLLAAEETDRVFHLGAGGMTFEAQRVALSSQLLGEVAGVGIVTSHALTFFVRPVKNFFLGFFVTGETELIFGGGEFHCSGFALGLHVVTSGA